MSYDFKCQVEKSDAALRKILLTRINLGQEVVKESGLSQSVNDLITEAIADEIPTSHIEMKDFDMRDESKILTMQDIKQVVLDNYDDKSEIDSHKINDKSSTDQIAQNNGEEEPEDKSEPEIMTTLENAVMLEEQGVSVGNVQRIESESEPIKQEELLLPDEESELSEEEDSHQADDIVFHGDEIKFELRNNSILEGEAEEEEDEASSESTELKNSSVNIQASAEDVDYSDEEKPLISRTNRQKCPHCIKSFATSLALERHMAVHKHKTKLRYVCYLCDKQFSNVAKLKNHVSNNHDSLKNEGRVDIDNNYSRVETEKREETAERESGVANDKQKGEKKNYKLKCKVCSKQFTYQKSFLSHIKNHPEYEVSEAAENHSEQLKTIEESIENQSDSSNSKINESDDDDLPLEGLQCTQCGKLFATKGNLKRHILTHSGLRFNCTTCGKEFSRLDKLKDHEQSKHKEEIFGASDDEDDDTDNEGRTNDGKESRRKVRNPLRLIHVSYTD